MRVFADLQTCCALLTWLRWWWETHCFLPHTQPVKHTSCVTMHTPVKPMYHNTHIPVCAIMVTVLLIYTDAHLPTIRFLTNCHPIWWWYSPVLLLIRETHNFTKISSHLNLICWFHNVVNRVNFKHESSLCTVAPPSIPNHTISQKITHNWHLNPQKERSEMKSCNPAWCMPDWSTVFSPLT